MKPTKITKLEDGSLDVEFEDGSQSNIAKEDADLQAFVIFRMLVDENPQMRVFVDQLPQEV